MHTAMWKVVLAASCFPQDTPELHGVGVVLALLTLTAELPAHCRLVSGHDPCEMVASLDCTASIIATSAATEGETGPASPRALPSGETRATFPPEPTPMRATRPGTHRSRPAARPPGTGCLDRCGVRRVIVVRTAVVTNVGMSGRSDAATIVTRRAETAHDAGSVARTSARSSVTAGGRAAHGD